MFWTCYLALRKQRFAHMGSPMRTNPLLFRAEEVVVTLYPKSYRNSIYQKMFFHPLFVWDVLGQEPASLEPEPCAET